MMISCPHCGKEVTLHTVVGVPSTEPVYKNLVEAQKLIESLSNSEVKNKLRNHVKVALESVGGTTMVTVSAAHAG